ncbi:N/A [soil metagenome]
MDRIILPYAGGPSGVPARGAGAQALSTTPQSPTTAPALAAPAASIIKGPGDYLRAIRRRFWLALAVAGFVALVGGIVVVRQQPVYRATAQVQIEPPRFDLILANLVADHEVGRLDPNAEQYASNRIIQLFSKSMVERVLINPHLGASSDGESESPQNLIKALKTQQLPRSSTYEVHLEGTNPARVTKILDLWLEEFAAEAKSEVDNKIALSRQAADNSLKQLEMALSNLDDTIINTLSTSPFFSPDGENLLVRRFETLGSLRTQKMVRADELEKQAYLARLYPSITPPTVTPQDQDLKVLLREKEYWENYLREAQRRIKNFHNDPAARQATASYQSTLERIHAVQATMVPESQPLGDPSEQILAMTREELRKMASEEEKLFRQIQQEAPSHNKFVTLLRERDLKYQGIAAMRQRLAHFDLVAESQNRPVEVVQRPVEPTIPVRPNRALLLAVVGLLSLAMGLGTVVALEHLDHSVRVPEQLSGGLGLPLLGIVPRMRHTARLHRGGHLWTPAAPTSAEADAYRNLRASLIGLTGLDGHPAVTLLVTSAKAGEGKSTTALNLAATCARSGERTLLMDVDLRRPSLGGVFDDRASDDPELGLVDILRGELPWQRTLVRTEIPNLDFLPTGDPSGTPIEILGARELRQLLIALSGHYDRVILDGPAILGLADCRMLGRIVDSALLVVRSGAHELRPLQRAKGMLEQSEVAIAGVVFNGLAEDVENWSCHGSHYYQGHHGDAAPSGRVDGARTQGLDASPGEPVALATR